MKLMDSSYILNVKDNIANLKFDGNELNLAISNILVSVNHQEPQNSIEITNTQVVMSSECTRKTTVTLEFFQRIKVVSNSNGKFRIEDE